ncbi:hypothetical protein ACJIZ3_003519 [Penstemon smallii]|uniref:Uncharacterized protein n=1 Tax=Penstemon smallii TaxID=265156 RepID=A0ABD3UB26_9LAMI
MISMFWPPRISYGKKSSLSNRLLGRLEKSCIFNKCHFLLIFFPLFYFLLYCWRDLSPFLFSSLSLFYFLLYQPEGERTREYDERVWIEEMGVDGHGRVRAAGQGVKPSKHHHSYASSLNDAIMEKIREELREELKEEMRGEMYQMRREMEQMREEMEQMRG